ncbi:MAG: hypothetical protein FJW31_29670 [Acidobacteria bacterium]|nr:hypothetical protein [Acidobacteriota bacterium]
MLGSSSKTNRQAALATLALSTLPLLASPGIPGNATSAANVNSRCTVEKVNVAPVGLTRVSAPFQDRLRQFVGARLDQVWLDDLSQRLRREFQGRQITTQVSRGSAPNQVAVTFQIEMSAREVDVDLAELQYRTGAGVSAAVDVSYRAGRNAAHAALATNNDDLVERYNDVRAGYERALPGRRFRLGLETAAWHSGWNVRTRQAARESSLYETRLQLVPSATVQFSQALTLQLGVGFERLEPSTPAVRTEVSSAVTGALRFQRCCGLSAETRQRAEAAYGLRSGPPSLSGDFSFTRHHAMARYGALRGRHEFLGAMQLGHLDGRAPWSERFTGGTSRILRGGNRFAITPAGAERLAHVSANYRWRKLRLAYDAGSVWQRGGEPVLRQSVGVGVSSNLRSGFSVMVAFPLRDGRVEPMLIAGMNF